MRTLNVVFDVLTLICLSIAAIALFAFYSMVQSLQIQPNINNDWVQGLRIVTQGKMTGAFVGMVFLGLFLVLSLVCAWRPTQARLLNLGMFASTMFIMLFLVGLMTTFNNIGRANARVQGLEWVRYDGEMMLVVTMTPIGFAIFFSLVRMIWTMPRGKPAAALPTAGSPLPPLPQAHALVVAPETESPADAQRLAIEQTGIKSEPKG